MPLPHALDVIHVLIEKELKAKYKGSALGIVWSILQPLLMAMVLYFAFQVVLKVKIENGAFYLISGLFIWNWVSVSINNSLWIYIINRSVIKKIAIDHKLLPLSVVLTEAINFLIALGIIAVFAIIYEVGFGKQWLLLPVVLIVQIAWLYGLSMIVSLANAFFRDVERIISFLLQILFYSSTIIYPLSTVSAEYQKIMLLNPVTPMIEVWHSIFMRWDINNIHLLIFVFTACVFLACGLFLQKQYASRVAEVL